MTVMLFTASSSATEQEEASGWQGTAAGRLPGSRNVWNTNCEENADAPATVRYTRGVLLFTPR